MSNQGTSSGSVQNEDEPYYESVKKNNPFSCPCQPLSRIPQIVFMSVTVVPIRLVLLLLVGLTTYIIACIASIGLCENQRHPVGGIRRSVIWFLQKLGRLLLFFMGIVNVEVVGKPSTPQEAPILAIAPHSSIYDMIMFFIHTPVPSCLSRQENSSFPIAGPLGKLNQVVYVSRSDRDSRRKAVDAITRRAKSSGNWPQIIIFPEGTMTNTSRLIKFKHGAFIPGVPVQPVFLEFNNSWDTTTWSCEDDGKLLQLIWYSLCQFYINAKVTYLDVYYPTLEEKINAELYADNVRQVIADYSHIPCSNLRNEDRFLMARAFHFGLPSVIGGIGFVEIQKKYGISSEKACELLDQFAEIAKPSSELHIDSFLKYLKLPRCDKSLELFNKYEVNRKGSIDFKSFVLGRIQHFDKLVSSNFSEVFNSLSGSKSVINFEQFKKKLLKMLDSNEIDDLYSVFTENFNLDLTHNQFKSVVVQKPEYIHFLMDLK